MQQVTINLPSSTMKKMRALAMLSGDRVSEIENIIVEYLDDFLSTEIRNKLNALDGKVPVASAEATENAEDAEDASDEDEDEDDSLLEEEMKNDDASGHTLSDEKLDDTDGDEDADVDDLLDLAFLDENIKRTEEQNKQQLATVRNTKTVTPETKTSSNGISRTRTKFEGGRVRARVSEYTGDGDDSALGLSGLV